MCDRLFFFCNAGFLFEIETKILSWSLAFKQFYSEKIKKSKKFSFIVLFLVIDTVRSFFFSIIFRFIILIKLSIQFLVEILLLGFFKTINEIRWINLFKKSLIGFFIGVFLLLFSIPLT